MSTASSTSFLLATSAALSWVNQILETKFRSNYDWLWAKSRCPAPTWCQWQDLYFVICESLANRICGLVVRIHGYRSRSPGFDSPRYHIFWDVRIIEELHEWIVADVWIRCAYQSTPSTSRSRYWLVRQGAVTRSVWFPCRLRATRVTLLYFLTFAGFLKRGALSDERMDL
jgi:hypothetical protein